VRIRAISASAALAAACSLLALASAWRHGPHVWRLLESEQATYAALSPAQRRQEPVTELGIPTGGAIFDFYAGRVVPGDRIYFQVQPGGFSSNLTLPEAIASLGRFYLLPGVETTNLADATVVVSWFANPALLHVKFLTQAQAGAQPIFVSRIRLP